MNPHSFLPNNNLPMVISPLVSYTLSRKCLQFVYTKGAYYEAIHYDSFPFGWST